MKNKISGYKASHKNTAHENVRSRRESDDYSVGFRLGYELRKIGGYVSPSHKFLCGYSDGAQVREGVQNGVG